MMTYRALAILAALLLALNMAGCHSISNKDYDEVLMPRQTGSVLQRRIQVPTDSNRKSKKNKTEKSDKKDKKDKEKARKPDAEPSATPAPEEESTPPPERFR